MLGFDKFPLAHPGATYVACGLLLTLVAIALNVWLLAVPLLAATLFIGFFFRDPARTPPLDDGVVLSPADGRVVAQHEVQCPVLDGRAQLVSIFMSIFDVHVNRMPISGEVLWVAHRPGRFGHAGKELARSRNERMEILVRDHEHRLVLFHQVAGMVARRIDCRLSVGQKLEKSQRFGMIRFGSRLDVYLPLSAKVLVKPGQKVSAGASIIAEL